VETCLGDLSVGKGSAVGLHSYLGKYEQESVPQEGPGAEHRLMRDGSKHWAAHLILERQQAQ